MTYTVAEFSSEHNVPHAHHNALDIGLRAGLGSALSELPQADRIAALEAIEIQHQAWLVEQATPLGTEAGIAASAENILNLRKQMGSEGTIDHIIAHAHEATAAESGSDKTQHFTLDAPHPDEMRRMTPTEYAEMALKDGTQFSLEDIKAYFHVDGSNEALKAILGEMKDVDYDNIFGPDAKEFLNPTQQPEPLLVADRPTARQTADFTPTVSTPALG